MARDRGDYLTVDLLDPTAAPSRAARKRLMALRRRIERGHLSEARGVPGRLAEQATRLGITRVDLNRALDSMAAGGRVPSLVRVVRRAVDLALLRRHEETP